MGDSAPGRQYDAEKLRTSDNRQRRRLGTGVTEAKVNGRLVRIPWSPQG